MSWQWQSALSGLKYKTLKELTVLFYVELCSIWFYVAMLYKSKYVLVVFYI